MAIERPGDAENAKELRRQAIAAAATQRRLLALAEAAPRREQFELYRSYDESMGTWLQVRLLRAQLDAAVAAKSPPVEQKLRTDLRDYARYALWEIDQNIAHVDAAEATSSRYRRLIEDLRSSLLGVRAAVVRLAAP